ncbi:MAG TPA: hypothetical protein VFQ26_03535, partial [Nitrospiraceae bacterium]|nr:hypothetical protein [Nitrospiraceae bacterium]
MAKDDNGDEPKVPSYDQVLKAIKKTDKMSKNQRKKAYQWADDFYAQAQELNKDVVGDLQEIMDFQMTSAEDTWNRYKTTFWNLEDEQIDKLGEFDQRVTDFDAEVEQLKADALEYKSEANQRYQAGKAQADVGQAFAQERSETERALRDQGVNPSSGASQSLTAGLRLAEGAAQAAAGTVAADTTRQEGDEKYLAALDKQIEAGALAATGLQARQNMVNVGAAYPGSATLQASTAATAGAQAVDTNIAPFNAATEARGQAYNWSTIGAQNLSTWTDAIDTGFKNELDLYNAETNRMATEAEIEASESSGIGSLLGAGAGILKSFLPGFNKGGAVEKGYALGGG